MEEDGLCLLSLARDDGDPGLLQASAGGTSGCHSSSASYKPFFIDITDIFFIAYSSFTDITGLPHSPPGHNSDTGGVDCDESAEFD